MNFKEWVKQYGKGHEFDIVEGEMMHDAWEASKAEERERIRFAISQSKLITLGEPSDYALVWNKACDEMLTLVNWTGDDTKAEQIRKGE